MVRKLKYHEKKLLKKVDFITWKSDKKNHREIQIIRKYHIQKREDYTKYNQLALKVQKITSKLKDLDPQDPFRIKSTTDLLEKLYFMGLISTRDDFKLCEGLPASSFCRRRLPVLMVKLHMSQSISDAVKLIEQGHVRVGPEIITDPAYLVTSLKCDGTANPFVYCDEAKVFIGKLPLRNMEDFITWSNTSKIRKHVMEYNEQLDDFDMMN